MTYSGPGIKEVFTCAVFIWNLQCGYSWVSARVMAVWRLDDRSGQGPQPYGFSWRLLLAGSSARLSTPAYMVSWAMWSSVSLSCVSPVCIYKRYKVEAALVCHLPSGCLKLKPCFKDLLIYFTCVYTGLWAHAFRFAQRPEEGVRYLGVGVTSSCEPLMWVLGWNSDPQ